MLPPAAHSIPPPPASAMLGEQLNGYKLCRILGTGSDATVWLAQRSSPASPSSNETQHPQPCCAIKVVSKLKVGQEGVLRVRLEAKVMQRLNGHPHIIQLFEFVETERYLFLVMELAEGMDLFEALYNEHPASEALRNGATEASIRRVFHQLGLAIAHCTSKGVAHRDLKPENVFLDRDFNVKLGDFGLCTRFRAQQRTKKKAVGSLLYAPPELLRGMPYVGPEVDVWCLGVILYEMFCMHPPFEAATERESIIKALKLDYNIPSWVPSTAADLITRMLQPTESRLTIEQVLSHPWLNGWASPTTASTPIPTIPITMAMAMTQLSPPSSPSCPSSPASPSSMVANGCYTSTTKGYVGQPMIMVEAGREGMEQVYDEEEAGEEDLFQMERETGENNAATKQSSEKKKCNNRKTTNGSGNSNNSEKKNKKKKRSTKQLQQDEEVTKKQKKKSNNNKQSNKQKSSKKKNLSSSISNKFNGWKKSSSSTTSSSKKQATTTSSSSSTTNQATTKPKTHVTSSSANDIHSSASPSSSSSVAPSFLYWSSGALPSTSKPLQHQPEENGKTRNNKKNHNKKPQRTRETILQQMSSEQSVPTAVAVRRRREKEHQHPSSANNKMETVPTMTEASCRCWNAVGKCSM
ncbi:MAPK-activated protein kinase Srk1 [Balamuthia mandrillaris]